MSRSQHLISGNPQQPIMIRSGAQDLLMNDDNPKYIHDGLGDDQYFTGGDATCIDFVDQDCIDDIQQEMMSMTNNVQEYLIDHGEMNVINDGESDCSTLPIGYRFKPDDKELIYCLRKKVNNEPLPTNKIYTVNLYDFGPHNLAEYFGVKREDHLYIITPLKVKNKRSKYADRTTPNSCWKAQSGEIPINCGGIEVGSRKTLVYYEAKHSKTNWIMHEYRLKDNSKEVAALVICKIHKKRK